MQLSSAEYKIKILNYGYFDTKLLLELAASVAFEFEAEVEIVEEFFDIDPYFDPSRNQYNGNQLLLRIDQKSDQSNCKTVGLFNVDLFIPILTFIFGQAYLGGKSAIASAYRLANERYGLSHDEELFRERFSKEIIHELGHSFGLIHCHNPGCVMQSSTYVEDIDQKSLHLCITCRNKINAKNS
jgi:archaemetzincin